MSSSKPRVLVTEDDPDTCDLIELLLTNEGYEVVCTTSPAEALLLARTKPFDLYLLDNWIPGTSGPDLCKLLREINDQIPVLFYSGAAFEKERIEALKCGAQGYLVKPCDPSLLLAEVDRLTGPTPIAD